MTFIVFVQLDQEGVFALAEPEDAVIALMDPDIPVGRQAVLAAPIADGTDAAGKMQFPYRYCCDGCHDGERKSIHFFTLQPHIFLREGVSPVSFDIACPFSEIHILPVQGQAAGDLVGHTDYAVSALHSGQILKRPHNIIGKRAEGAIPEIAFQVCVDAESAAVLIEDVVSDLYE